MIWLWKCYFLWPLRARFWISLLQSKVTFVHFYCKFFLDVRKKIINYYIFFKIIRFVSGVDIILHKVDEETNCSLVLRKENGKMLVVFLLSAHTGKYKNIGATKPPQRRTARSLWKIIKNVVSLECFMISKCIMHKKKNGLKWSKKMYYVQDQRPSMKLAYKGRGYILIEVRRHINCIFRIRNENLFSPQDCEILFLPSELWISIIKVTKIVPF